MSATPINPYWEAIREHISPDDPFYGPCVGRIGLEVLTDPDAFEKALHRDEFVRKYAWSITDPDSVAFVAEHAAGGLVDPMAGSGYWAYLLGQLDVDVACYDLEPGANAWHSDVELWVPIETLDGAEAVAKHPDRTLLLAWPPYSEDVGARILRAYAGGRVIFIGESGHGCTGDEDMHELLENEWHETTCHRPVQWWGLHDYITVYDRVV